MLPDVSIIARMEVIPIKRLWTIYELPHFNYTLDLGTAAWEN